MNSTARRARLGIAAALVLGSGCVQIPPVNTSTARAQVNTTQPVGPPGDSVSICVIERDTLRLVRAVIVRETRDTIVAGRPFAEVYPPVSPPYASGSTWFSQNEPIRLKSRWYYGGNHPPQRISPELLEPIGHHHGVPYFAEAGDTIPEIIYVPVRPGCVFQSYIGIQTRPDVP